MTRPLRLCLALAALLSLLLLPVAARAATPGASRADTLLLRTGPVAQGGLVTLSSAGGHTALRLPLGVSTPNGRMLYVAAPLAGGRSLVRAVDAVSGRTLRSLTIAGRYTTTDGDYAAATLSYNGRWLALRSMTSDATHTGIVVVDTSAMRAVATPRLAGRFGLDAVDAQGARLYLVESLARRGPQAYQVRSYDLRHGALDATPVVDKGETTDTMSGVAWTRAWAPGGDWLFTLYVKPNGQGAFIHALGLSWRLAHCIDLPGAKASAADLARYALAVSADGATLYAVNPALGRALAIRGGLPFGTPQEMTLPARAASAARTLHPIAIASAYDQSGMRAAPRDTLYVATDRGVWVVDGDSLAPRATYLRGRVISSVALSPDGRRLYAMDKDRAAVVAIDPASGRVLGAMPAGAGAWAIAQVVE